MSQKIAKEIRLNAFAMNCVAHQSPGLWTHPRDCTAKYNRLPYWLDLAKTLERGRFDGLFLADVLGVYDVYSNAFRRDGSELLAVNPAGFIYRIRVGAWELLEGRQTGPTNAMVCPRCTVNEMSCRASVGRP